MKKLIALLSSIIIISGCSTITDQTTTSIQTTEQLQSYSVEDKQAQNEIENNKSNLNFLAQSIFNENFADDFETDMISQNGLFTNNAIQKGGTLFNLLNKSILAQKVAYAIADYPVGAHFHKKHPADNVPTITKDQISELKSLLKPGDIMLTGNDGTFIHGILYIGNDTIIHSLANKGKNGNKFIGVTKETLTDYFGRGERDTLMVLRYKNLDQSEISKVIDYANKQLGKSYDTLFLMNSDTRFYCTELVFQSFMQLKHPPRLFSHKIKMGWQIITVDDFMDSPDLETIWSLHKQRPATGKLHTYN